MSVDLLQDRIRKDKNPSVVSFEFPMNLVPPQFREEGRGEIEACGAYAQALLEGLRGLVPAVRLPFGLYCLYGGEGIQAFDALVKKARKLGYYILLDGFGFATSMAASLAAERLFKTDAWDFDGLMIPVYLGSDILRPFVPLCEEQGKDLFVTVRTSNRSAPDLQDLRTGSRLVHSAAMDLVNRFGETSVGKRGYSRIAAVLGAGLPDGIRSMRAKYQHTFFLVDGYDYPNGNAKNCSYAFDRMGHGAAACAGTSITGAWAEAGSDGQDCVERAVEAAMRMKKNLTRYVTIL